MSEAVIWDTIINSHSQQHPFSPIQYVNKYFSTSAAPKKLSKSKQAALEKAKKLKESEPEPGIIKLKNTKPKYQITDISGKLAERANVTLQLGWNVQPWVGALTWTLGEGKEFGRWKGVTGGISQAFDMPPLKGKGSASETVVGSGGTPKAAEASAAI